MDSMSATAGFAEPFLERSRELSLLAQWLREAHGGMGGRLALVAGEAGVGKTTLLRRACEEAPEGTRIIWGACDSLFTPQPLGPLLDVAEQTGGELAEIVEAGGRPHPVATALLRELAGQRPTLLVIEDLHWVDESSLDVLRIVARRIGSVPLLLLASYRDDELERGHPLRIVLGELATAERVSRIALAPLSPGAVADLAAPRSVDAEQLYRVTGGNAFYVTEVLAAGDDTIPDNVRDAVLARVARLSPEARQLLEAASIVPPPVDLALLEALVPNSGDQLDECLTAGVLTTVAGGLAFRHELARLAVEESLPTRSRAALHARALAVLSADPDAEVARLAQHAEEAGDEDAVLRFAPVAAAEASGAGAHRAAAAQLARALRFVDDAPSAVRGALLEQQTFETTLIGEYSEALALGRAALACWRALGDQLREGRALSALAWPLWSLSATAESASAAHEAVDLLEQLPPGLELMATYVQLGSMLWASAPLDAVEWGKKGLDLAERLEEPWWAVQARVAIAVANWWCNPPAGQAQLEEALDLARRERVDGAVGFGYSHLTGMAMCFAMYAEAEHYANEGIEYCTQHDLDSYTPQLVAMRGDAELAQGRWTEAAASAALVLARHRAGVAAFTAFATIGRLRARRGEPGVWEALDEAKRQSEPSGELWRMAPVAAARAEAAWLEGRNGAVVEETEAAMELARTRDAGWVLGELGVWRKRAGHEESVAGAIEPYASELAGDWSTAASRWRALGSEYEAALALAHSADDEPLRQAYDGLRAMGAAPAAAIVARRLRSRGARGLPRGPRRRTRENPANLTGRELEILGLVAEGMRNGEIAERLFLSQKTVAHHVSAILRKLDVHTRGEAAAAAIRLGLTHQDR
jgi:DNA-binding CsgD family transcriptional regulator